MNFFDWLDIIAFVGLTLIGISVYLLIGWMGMVGYVGALLIVFSAFAARSRAGDL